jgi:hypothetical protein
MYIRTMSVLLKISSMRYFWTIILSIFILGFHSCGMVSRVREQGESKSWVVSGPTNAERSYSKRSVSDEEEVADFFINPSITTTTSSIYNSESSH